MRGSQTWKAPADPASSKMTLHRYFRRVDDKKVRGPDPPPRAKCHAQSKMTIHIYFWGVLLFWRGVSAFGKKGGAETPVQALRTALLTFLRGPERLKMSGLTPRPTPEARGPKLFMRGCRSSKNLPRLLGFSGLLNQHDRPPPRAKHHGRLSDPALVTF